MALPDFIDINDPARNLAALDAVAVSAPQLNPNQRQYVAYDGTPIGSGNDCDPLTAEPTLSGLDDLLGFLVPDILEENRLAYWEQYALPLLLGSTLYATGRPPLTVAGWTLAAYMAPFAVGAGWALLTLVGGARLAEEL